MSCREINLVKYVTADITVKCYEFEHNIVLIANIIGLFVWVIAIPYFNTY
jgi:hypothetical protein